MADSAAIRIRRYRLKKSSDPEWCLKQKERDKERLVSYRDRKKELDHARYLRNKENPTWAEKEKQRRKKWRKANMGELVEQNRKYLKANPEKLQESLKRLEMWAAINKEKAAEAKVRYRELNKEKTKERGRLYRAKKKLDIEYMAIRRERDRFAKKLERLRNPQKVRQRETNKTYIRRLRKKNNPYEKIDLDIVYKNSRGLCGICQKPLARKEMTIDHKTPLARGGWHVYKNVQAAHLSCNCRKGAKTMEELFSRFN